MPTWSGRRWLVSKPTPARPPPTASSVKNLPVRKDEESKIGARNRGEDLDEEIDSERRIKLSFFSEQVIKQTDFM